MNWTTTDYLSLIAIVVSILALLMPLWQYLYQKFFRPLKIRIIPFNKTAFLFNESGSYIKMKFSIDCENQDMVISKIGVEVTSHRKVKKEILLLNWNFFEPVNFNWLGSNMSNSINTTAYARPIKVNKSSIEPFIIEFSSNSQDVINELSALSDERSNSLNNYIATLPNKDTVKIQEVIDGYKNTNEYSTTFNAYEKYLFWEAGDYSLKVIIEYGKDKQYTQTYKFSLDSQEAQKIKENIEKTIFCRFLSQNNISSGLNGLFKDLISG